MLGGGFFDELETQGSLKKDNCSACGLSVGCKSPAIQYSGKGKKGILIIGECPSENDDAEGITFAGESGAVLKKALSECGINLEKDCYRTTAIGCHTTKEIKDKEIQFCRKRINEMIDTISPKLIILLGSAALKSIIGVEWKKDIGTITRWRGFCIPSRFRKCWISLSFAPSYVLKSKKEPVVDLIFRNDIKQAIDCLGKPLPYTRNERDFVKIIFKENELVEYFKNLYATCLDKEDEFVSFDYESTGVKPHAKGHEILCCSFCYKEDEAIAFPFPLGTEAARWFKRIITNPLIKKSAHNMKFEHSWTYHILGYDVQGWDFCTLTGAHIIDNRPYVSGLKFQSFINFGTSDYDSHLASYMTSDNDNAFNNLRNVPISELLLYCGIDSLVQYRLAKIQHKIMEEACM